MHKIEGTAFMFWKGILRVQVSLCVLSVSIIWKKMKTKHELEGEAFQSLLWHRGSVFVWNAWIACRCAVVSHVLFVHACIERR